MQEEAVGQVFWHPKGYALYRTLEDYVRRRLEPAGYQEVKTPLLIDRKLWEMSGHWENYREHMFVAEVEDEKPDARGQADELSRPRADLQAGDEILSRTAAAPGRVRLLPPLRAVGRAARLMRVRAFTQDDAHIFCTHEQITGETAAFCRLLLSMSIATSASRTCA